MPGLSENLLPEPYIPVNTKTLPVCRHSGILQDNTVLAVIGFSGATRTDARDPRRVSIGMPGIGDELVEIWHGSSAVSCGQSGRIGFACNGDVLFGHLLVVEPPASDLGLLVERAYAEIMDFLPVSGYPYPFRFWNYVPGINRIQDGLERYQAFCVGRHAALGKRPESRRTLAAASAVGSSGSGLLISFLAGKVKPVQIENPRQVSAFRYPSRYSPRSPLFSRAVYTELHGMQRLYLSGTASITGHESRHAGDVIAQTRELCLNIKMLQGIFRKCSGTARSVTMTPSGMRVYLRQPEHLEAVSGVLAECLGVSESTIYLKGDICRASLLVEVECIFTITGAGPRYHP